MADVDSTSTAASLVGFMSDKDDRISKVLRTYALGSAAVALGVRWWKKVDGEITYQVSVPSNDEIYTPLHTWLIENIEPRRRRAVTVRSSRSSSPAVVGDHDRRPKPRTPVNVYYDGSRRQKVAVGGYRVGVEVEKDENKTLPPGEWSMLDRERIVFSARGTPARDAIVSFLSSLAVAQQDQKQVPKVVCAGKYGWAMAMDLPSRPIDTVVLRSGMMEDLCADLRSFLDHEKDYVRLGIPWHRGYLFEGPPGSGKTSIARALASHFGMNVYSLSLSDVNKDSDLNDMLSEVRPRSMLLLEDIDNVHSSRERDDDSRLSMSGLLNALDGLATPHGLITAMTTNRVGVLDPALLRPGRSDRHFQIGNLDDDQLSRLLSAFLGRKVTGLSVGSKDVSPAAIVEILKENMDDHRQALAAVKAYL